MKCIVGIDLSFSCPAVCVHTGDTFSLANCQFYFLTDKRKFFMKEGQFIGTFYKDFPSQEYRIDWITGWVVDKIPLDNSSVFLEGYSFGSRAGMAFNIGELGGVLKHKLYCEGIKVCAVPPTVVKKFATNKGNAKKDLMCSTFYEETKFDLLTHLHCVRMGLSPQADIVDSYYIARYGFEKT